MNRHPDIQLFDSAVGPVVVASRSWPVGQRDHDAIVILFDANDSAGATPPRLMNSVSSRSWKLFFNCDNL